MYGRTSRRSRRSIATSCTERLTNDARQRRPRSVDLTRKHEISYNYNHAYLPIPRPQCSCHTGSPERLMPASSRPAERVGPRPGVESRSRNHAPCTSVDLSPARDDLGATALRASRGTARARHRVARGA
jgi:hypothetical protein